MMNNNVNPAPETLLANSFPPLMYDALIDVQRQTNTSLLLGFSTALSMLSLALQSRYDVMRPGGYVGPISTFILVVADSGEGKSTVKSLFDPPLKEYLAIEREKFEDDLIVFNVEDELWLREKLALLKPKRNRLSEMDADTVKIQLLELERRKPVPPLLKQLIVSDITTQATLEVLSKSPSIGLFSDEGSKILEGLALQFPAHYNSLWSGDEVQFNRKTSGSFVLTNARLCILIMVQSKAFLRFMQKKGEAMDDLGVLARTLIAWPLSTQGIQQYNGYHIYDNYVRGAGLSAFNRRISQLLNDIDWNNPKAEKKTLTFSTEAAMQWSDFKIEMDFQRRPSSEYASIRPFVAKAPEHCARIAALFHLCESDQGEISSKTIKDAISVVRWFLHEHRRVLEMVSTSSFNQDSEILYQWLCKYSYSKTRTLFQTSELLRNVTDISLRKAKRFHPAIDQLVYQGRAQRFLKFDPSTNRNTQHVEVYLPQQPINIAPQRMMPSNQPSLLPPTGVYPMLPPGF